jgi:hypothetical protein
LADTFDRSAELAEEHASRLPDRFGDERRAYERDVARRARETAHQARDNANRLRRATGPPEVLDAPVEGQDRNG